MPTNEKLSVQVRMYRQGLGDCFLLKFNKGQNNFNLLIDCGIFFATKNGKKIMTQVAEDIRDTTNKHLNAVVLTHDHYDHHSGFKLAKDVFNKADFKFDEVWVGWTEDENHPKYGETRERFKKILKGLRTSLNAELKFANEELKGIVNSLVNDFFGMDDSESNFDIKGMSSTWEYLLKEKAGKVKYCTPGTSFDLSDVGIRIYILGPPEDLDLIEKEEPTDEESYRHSLRMSLANSFLAAATAEDDSIFDSNSFLPFDEVNKIEINSKKPDPFFKENYGYSKRKKDAWRQIDEDWLSTAGELALWMDDYTNNTCLALAIELIESEQVLIFPGDAQFGNLNSWKDLTWEVPDGNSGKREVKANELLARTVFYKVGHHGSHNATLRKSGLEIMNISKEDFVAMIPTNQDFAKSKGKNGWKMPEPKLMERLEEKTNGRVIMADEYGSPTDEKKPFKERCKRLNLPEDKRSSFLKNVKFSDKKFVRNKKTSNKEEPLYVEFTIEV